MRWLKRILLLLLFAAVFYWALLFRLENTTPIGLSLVFLRLPEASLSIWIVAAFALGVLLCLLLHFWVMLRHKGRALLLKRQLQQCQQQLDRLQDSKRSE